MKDGETAADLIKRIHQELNEINRQLKAEISSFIAFLENGEA
jgi:hypothetical protein